MGKGEQAGTVVWVLWIFKENEKRGKEERDEGFDGQCIKDEVGGVIGTACEFWHTVTHGWAREGQHMGRLARAWPTFT